jgi:hypothetical protein
LLVRKEAAVVAVVASMEAFPGASLAQQVDVPMPSTTAIVLGSTVGEEWYKHDLETAGTRILHLESTSARIQPLEAAAAT